MSNKLELSSQNDTGPFVGHSSETRLHLRQPSYLAALNDRIPAAVHWPDGSLLPSTHYHGFNFHPSTKPMPRHQRAA
jgi:hypothetical protein